MASVCGKNKKADEVFLKRFHLKNLAGYGLGPPDCHAAQYWEKLAILDT